ncbi:MAG TPA: MazG family protein [Candidatus Pelethocola excrementipullorum]|nr:MazG family protein [Candidatus Pelethocola excrementipullorum]
MERKYTMEEFLGIIRKLRGENGCPWDKVQTHESLIPCMLEEAYEAVDGIETLAKGGSSDNLCEELGDVLMQVVFHSQLAEEEGYFTLEDVVDGISKKMIHRHPHVFGKATEADWDWESLKKEEKGSQTPKEEIASVPQALPSLLRTSKILKKLDKYYEFGRDEEESLRVAESQIEALKTEQDDEKKEEQIGEALLQLCNYARLNHINSELLLEKTLKNHLKSYEIQ